MPELSDTQIRARLRNVLSRHWIDMEKTSFLCTKGIVRMSGKIERQDADSAAPVDACKLENIERDIRQLRGVRRVHFDFKNWRRTEEGGWRPLDERILGQAAVVQEESPEWVLPAEDPEDCDRSLV